MLIVGLNLDIVEFPTIVDRGKHNKQWMERYIVHSISI